MHHLSTIEVWGYGVFAFCTGRLLYVVYRYKFNKNKEL